MKTKLALVAIAALLFACKKDPGPEITSRSQALEAKLPPDEIVYAASNALRVIDGKSSQVVASVPLQRAVYAIDSSLDGRTIYVASSDGIYEVDAATNAFTLLTNVPASDVRLSESGKTISVLQHEVIAHKNGTRDIEPYHLAVVDLASRRLVSDEEVGPRVFFASPVEEKRHGLVVGADGTFRLTAPGQSRDAAKDIEVKSLLAPGQTEWRLRNAVAASGGHVYVAIEGRPSRIVDVDLDRGTASAIDLGRLVLIRGLAVSPDRKVLYANGVKELLAIDLEKRSVSRALDLGAAHTGLSLSTNGRFAAMAQTVDGTGGSVTLVRLDPLAIEERIHLDDISPWAIAIRRR